LLLSILAASGMRLDEAALLNWEDVKEEGGITYFDLTHRADTVKNIGSARKVPVHPVLSGKIAVGAGRDQMFPQFRRDRDGKAQAPASKACMIQIRKITEDKSKVVHSLRGNFKDMMRDAGVPKEVNDFITGHGSGDVAGSYGSGPSMAVRKAAMMGLSFPFLEV
jgi:integrase